MPIDLIYIMAEDLVLLDFLDSLFSKVGYSVSKFTHSKQVLENILQEKPACIVAETRILKNAAIAKICEHDFAVPVILIGSDCDDIGTAVNAIRAGASDFFELPVIDRLLIESVQKAISS